MGRQASRFEYAGGGGGGALTYIAGARWSLLNPASPPSALPSSSTAASSRPARPRNSGCCRTGPPSSRCSPTTASCRIRLGHAKSTALSAGALDHHGAGLSGPEKETALPVRIDVRRRCRSRPEVCPSGARSTVVRSRPPPVPASAGRTPTPSPRAIRLSEVSCERRCPERRSPRTSPARTPAGSTGWWYSDSPHGDARNSRVRRPRHDASEGQGPDTREPFWNEAGSASRARVTPA